MSYRVHTFFPVIHNAILYTTHLPPILHTPAQTIFTAQFTLTHPVTQSRLTAAYHTPQHITLHYTTQLHLITELHTRFLNILIPFTMKMVGPLETHERLLNYCLGKAACYFGGPGCGRLRCYIRAWAPNLYGFLFRRARRTAG